MNHFHHMSLHLAIGDQISIDQRPANRARYEALRRRLDVHETEHVILECLGETLWRSQRDGKPMDAVYYLESLRRHSSLR